MNRFYVIGIDFYTVPTTLSTCFVRSVNRMTSLCGMLDAGDDGNCLPSIGDTETEALYEDFFGWHALTVGSRYNSLEDAYGEADSLDADHSSYPVHKEKHTTFDRCISCMHTVRPLWSQIPEKGSKAGLGHFGAQCHHEMCDQCKNQFWGCGHGKCDHCKNQFWGCGHEKCDHCKNQFWGCHHEKCDRCKNQFWGCHKWNRRWNAVTQATSLTSAATAAAVLLSYHPGIGNSSHGNEAWELSPGWLPGLHWTEFDFQASPTAFASAYAIYGLCLLFAIQSHQHHFHQNRFLLFGSLCGIGLGVLKPHIPYLGAGEWISYLPATVLVALLLSLVCHLLVPGWRWIGVKEERAVSEGKRGLSAKEREGCQRSLERA